jgi:hypothetical protein
MKLLIMQLPPIRFIPCIISEFVTSWCPSRAVKFKNKLTEKLPAETVSTLVNVNCKMFSV